MKIQLLFRDTGLLLTREELAQFFKNIKYSKERGSLCANCATEEACRALLVDFPAPQITFAMNARELDAAQDLVFGTRSI